MKQILGQDDLITEISRRARFTKGDIKVILDELIGLMEELVRTDDGTYPKDNKAKVLMRVRDFGLLLIKRIPPRKGNKGEMLPESSKVFFRLSEKIRFANREERVELDLDNEEEM